MSERPQLTPRTQTERDLRETRLAQALRENLRRRKAQTRARAPTEPAPTDLSGAEASHTSNGNEEGGAAPSRAPHSERLPESK